ncbi:PaaI family thioesterase [Acinetobacter baumannii]|uniref:PaaI family thioesterase n=1 Tax=Acinetobacter baumannii TaxID=470 RepID=UPI00054B574A|nr:PaaI family thioesterase [Acinetobacter baumannii]
MNSNDVMKQWEETEKEILQHIGSPDVVPLSELTKRSGLDVFNAIFSGELPSPPIGETLDYIPVHMEYGIAIFQGRPQRKHYNPLGTVHGGWFCTLLDSAVACAIHTTLPAGKAYTTLELKVNMVRALTEETPLVRAEGKIIHVGRQTATAEGRIVGPDGKIYAHATTTCLIFDAPKAS